MLGADGFDKRSCRLAMSISEVVRNNADACYSVAMPLSDGSGAYL
jgi:hypothetical protein